MACENCGPVRVPVRRARHSSASPRTDGSPARSRRCWKTTRTRDYSRGATAQVSTPRSSRSSVRVRDGPPAGARTQGRAVRRARLPPILPVSDNCTDHGRHGHVVHGACGRCHCVAVVGCTARVCIRTGSQSRVSTVSIRRQPTLGSVTGSASLRPRPATPRRSSGRCPGSSSSARRDTDSGRRLRGDRPQRRRPGGPSRKRRFRQPRLDLGERSSYSRPRRARTRADSRAEADFGVLHVNDACTLTPTCTNLCPTDAIQRTGEGELTFDHADCVICGLCEEGCPETATRCTTDWTSPCFPRTGAARPE